MSKSSDAESSIGSSQVEEFKELTVDETARKLSTSLLNGLSTQQVKQKILEFGYNEVKEKTQSPLFLFLKKFWDLTAWMLEITIVLTLVLGKYLDLYIITALLFLNAILGFTQELRANAAVESLKQKLQVSARVLRESDWSVVPARDLVPGDIVRVRSGDFVPADLKIVDEELEIDQSALTGESLPVRKGRSDILYSGSIIRKGESNGIVISIGARTYFGRTAQLVQLARPKLHMEAVISSTVKWLLLMVACLLGIAFVFTILRGIDIFGVLPLALVLLVSAIPVALPAMFTISMAIGSLQLAKQGVLVTQLNASEDAATMDTLCVDKTGTITMNKLSIADVAVATGYKREDVLLYGALASEEANQDPIDIAFIHGAREGGAALERFAQKKFVPFDASTRMTESQIQEGSREFSVMKGADSVIMPLCNLGGDESRRLEERTQEFANRGFRAIAVATTRTGKPTLIGIAALYDAPRPDSKALVSEIGNLGIKTKMLTGEALPVAKEIADLTGIGANIARTSDLENLLRNDKPKAIVMVEESNGFAEIYPEGKYTIVKSLQSANHVVGMTGDGVNDSPALKQAEIGIAVSNATDVAKGAASVVLTNDGLGNIVDLVKTGRKIYQRIITWILNKVVKTFQIVVFVVIAFLLTGQYVVSAFDIVVLIFGVDFVTISLSTDNVRWSKEPNRWNVTGLVREAVFLGIFVVAESLGMLYIGSHVLGLGSEIERLHTFVFDLLLFSGLFTIFVVRERGHFWESVPSKTLLAAIIADIMIFSLYSMVGIPGILAISPVDIAVTLVYCAVFNLIVNDFMKIALTRYLIRRQS